MRATGVSALSLCALVAAAQGCTDDNPDTAELSFHGEQQALPGFTYDTGFQPASGPIQVRFELTAVGKLTADAKGAISDTALVGTAGSGQYALETKIKVKAYLKMDVAGQKYNGPLAGAPDMALSFGDKATFDPFLLGQKASVTGTFPETKLGTINLAGALSAVPGIKGDLVISAAGTVNSDFTGICASVKGDLAQYTGSTSTSGTLTLKPSVEISLPLGVSKKLAPFEIKIPIPAVTAAMDLGTRSISGGTVSGEGPCSGAAADGGPGDGGQLEGGLKDGAPTDAPGDGPLTGDGLTDGPPPEQACPKIGTADNCAFCGDKCPGPEDSATKRACESGACTIHCKGAYYDINGKASDGCEILDTLVQNSTQATAKDLGSASDCDSAKKTSAALLSDNRYHLLPPNDRKLGTAYWFKLAIADKALCSLTAAPTLDFASLPKTAKYSVTIHWVCKKDSKVLKSVTKSADGGKSVTLTPDTNCAGIDDSGTLYLKVTKSAGATVHSNSPFTVSINP